MKRKLQILPAFLVLLAAGFACNLPKSESKPATPPNAPAGIETPASQSNTSVDFSVIILKQSDLPQGFEQISEAELAQYGLDVNALLNSISTPLAKAKPENLAIFSKADGLNTTFIVSFILQPLTLLERAGFDILAKNPQKTAQLFQKAVTDFTFVPQTGVFTIGDSMIDMTFSYSKVSLPLVGNLVISRHKQVVQVVVETSLLGATPAVSAYDVSRTMDDKISNLLK